MHTEGATVYRWSELATDRPMPLIERQRIIGSQAMISRVLLRKGFTLATHAHSNEQFGVVLSGRIRFGLGAEGSAARTTATLGAGEVIHLPAHLPHSAEALEETIILDIFAPPSEKTGVDEKAGG